MPRFQALQCRTECIQVCHLHHNYIQTKTRQRDQYHRYRTIIPKEALTRRPPKPSSPPPVAPRAEVIDQVSSIRARRVELKSHISELREIISVGKMNNVISGRRPLQGFELHMERLSALREELAILNSSPEITRTGHNKVPQQIQQPYQTNNPSPPQINHSYQSPTNNHDHQIKTNLNRGTEFSTEVKRDDATTSMQIPINMQDSVQPSPSPRQLLLQIKEDRSRRRNSLLQEKERLLQELEALEANEKAEKSTRASPNVYQYSPRQPQGRSRRKTFNQMMTSPQW